MLGNEAAPAPPGVTEVAYLASSAQCKRLVRTPSRTHIERAASCILLSSRHTCNSVVRYVETDTLPGRSIRTEPRKNGGRNIKQLAAAAAAITTHQLQLRSLCFPSLSVSISLYWLAGTWLLAASCLARYNPKLTPPLVSWNPRRKSTLSLSLSRPLHSSPRPRGTRSIEIPRSRPLPARAHISVCRHLHHPCARPELLLPHPPPVISQFPPPATTERAIERREASRPCCVLPSVPESTSMCVCRLSS